MSRFTFIDLFSGIGGFRLALESLGGTCVFSSDIDENARRTYFHNFNDVPYGDIRESAVKGLIPLDFDVLCAGFPCQAFSVAGLQKGFSDERGTLFFEVVEILREHRPKAFILENVKHLLTHGGGETIRTMLNTLRSLNYAVYLKVMDASKYANVPQHRERVFFVGFQKDSLPDFYSFEFPDKRTLTVKPQDLFDYGNQDESLYYTERYKMYDVIKEGVKDPSCIYQYRRMYVRENKSGVCPTLTANMGGGGHNVPLILDNGRIRKLSVRECLRLQGFPESFSFPPKMSSGAKYKQIGNSVVVPLVRSIAENVLDVIFDQTK